MRTRLPVVGPLELALYLRSVPSFRTLRPPDLVLLAQLTREQWVRRGTPLRTEVVHLLVEGEARVQRAGGSPGSIEAPEAIGLVELLADAELDARCVAETNLLVFEIDRVALLDLVEEQFSFFTSLRQTLGEQVRELRQAVAMATSAESEARDGHTAPPAAPFGFVERLISASRSRALSGFGVGVLGALVRDGQELCARRGECLWEAGDEAEFLALILDGAVTVTDAGSGRSFRAAAGAVLGVEAVFGGAPHPYGAIVGETATVIRVDSQALLDVAEDHSHVAAQILAYLARTLLHLRERGADESPSDDQGPLRSLAEERT